MKKIFAATCLLVAFAVQAACEDKYAYGKPEVIGNFTTLCRTGYAVIHDNLAKIPFATFEYLQPEKIGRGQNRRVAFHEDPDIAPQYRSKPKDYAKSSYDTGHLANAQNASDQQAMNETFLMSNMAPQVPSFNRGQWKNLETKIAKQVRAGRELYVITGTLVVDDERIGNWVKVPLSFYKVVIDKKTNMSAGYLLQNEVNNKSYRSGRMAVGDLQKIIKIDFFPQATPAVKAQLGILGDPSL